MHILRPDRRPLSAQAYDQLVALLREGHWKPGEQLPPEAQLAAQLGISRATLREALRLLEEEGRIVRRQGAGTFVAPEHRLESGLERLESVRSLAARLGMEAVPQDVVAEVVEATPLLADRLRVEPGSPLTRVSRTMLVNGLPVAYLEDFVPLQWLSPDDLKVRFAGSVLDLLRQNPSLRVKEARAEILALPATRALAQRLQVRPGDALLLLEETLFDVAGTPLNFSYNYFVPERFRFYVVRK
ncbi:MAG: GntR family transcriptional regulator [Anaerolineae bacterium]|nr:GntR family transcriptional regulator [Anaerolineae bacterium]MCX8068038.1 GntR family transcriptional regulator [Anaerolineae bacterium]MDW7992822.1 GntR family transcriptional regulator [Anaerolineae bacterium]